MTCAGPPVSFCACQNFIYDKVLLGKEIVKGDVHLNSWTSLFAGKSQKMT